MLLPRFSLRNILWIVTLCAAIFFINGFAYRGELWAIGVSVAIGSIVVFALFHAAFYGIALGLSRVIGTEQLPARTSRGGIEHGASDE